MDSSAFRPLKPPSNLTQTLVARLSEEIVSGKLAPGAKLPTEQGMMATFRVSRTVVREAVAALRANGLVVTRQGSGVFVADDVRRRPFRIDPDNLGSIREVLLVMELRTSVEVEAAGLAAERHTASQLADIKAALDDIGKAVASDTPSVDADYHFHVAIAVATGNHYYRNFMEFLGNFIIPRRSVQLSRQAAVMADYPRLWTTGVYPRRWDTEREQRAYLQRIQAEHTKIYRAIEVRDAGAARDAARNHLMNSRHRYQRLAQSSDGASARNHPEAEIPTPANVPSPANKMPTKEPL